MSVCVCLFVLCMQASVCVILFFSHTKLAAFLSDKISIQTNTLESKPWHYHIYKTVVPSSVIHIILALISFSLIKRKKGITNIKQKILHKLEKKKKKNALRVFPERKTEFDTS